MRFSGTLCVLDEPSSGAPFGAKGRRILMPSTVAEEALSTLIGCPVTVSASLATHEKEDTIGIVERAWIDGCRLEIEGALHHQSEHLAGVLPEVLGMSYVTTSVIEDMRRVVWRMTKATFTSVAVLLRDKAAYGKKTRFEICQ